jgi:hypothetical protein
MESNLGPWDPDEAAAAVAPNPAGWSELRRMAANMLAGVVWELPSWVAAAVLWWRRSRGPA